jgi:hypothetical protein
MQFSNIMLAMGFAALVLGTGKDASNKDEAAYIGDGSAMTTVSVTKGEFQNAYKHGGHGKDRGGMTEDAASKTTGKIWVLIHRFILQKMIAHIYYRQ